MAKTKVFAPHTAPSAPPHLPGSEHEDSEQPSCRPWGHSLRLLAKGGTASAQHKLQLTAETTARNPVPAWKSQKGVEPSRQYSSTTHTTARGKGSRGPGALNPSPRLLLGTESSRRAHPTPRQRLLPGKATRATPALPSEGQYWEMPLLLLPPQRFEPRDVRPGQRGRSRPAVRRCRRSGRSLSGLGCFSAEYLYGTDVFSLSGRQPIPLTFLRDADGATAHPDPQGIDPCVNEVLGLSSGHNCGEQKPVGRETNGSVHDTALPWCSPPWLHTPPYTSCVPVPEPGLPVPCLPASLQKQQLSSVPAAPLRWDDSGLSGYLTPKG